VVKEVFRAMTGPLTKIVYFLYLPNIKKERIFLYISRKINHKKNEVEYPEIQLHQAIATDNEISFFTGIPAYYTSMSHYAEAMGLLDIRTKDFSSMPDI
jgi:hypothetical protein